MKLSANQASKEAGIAKKTLLDALKSGRMSADKNDKGHWEIDPSELFRVFPRTGATPVMETETHPLENRSKTIENSILEVELKAERQMRERLEAEIMDLRGQRDKWQMQAERLLLEKPLQTAPDPVAIKAINQNPSPQATEKPRGVFSRIFG